MSENSQYLTQKQFKEGFVEWAEKVFLPAFEKILDSKLGKYLGTKEKNSKSKIDEIFDDKFDPILDELRLIKRDLKFINKILYKIGDK